MFNKVNIVVALLTVVCCFSPITANKCIGNFTTLKALQVARGNKTETPVTYIICPNTVFNFTNTFETWDLNGNATYLCGANGSSANNCVVTDGEVQFGTSLNRFGYSNKGNIFVSGFRFANALYATGVLAAPGKFTLPDCIFKVRN
jgi:hypothetical protein